MRPRPEVPRRLPRHLLATLCLAFLSACSSGNGNSAPVAQAPAGTAPADGRPFVVEEVAQFNEPWAMEFLPDGRLLVAEKPGALKLVEEDGTTTDIEGVPEVDHGGQGGLGDIALHPEFERNGWIYLSYAEAGDGDSRGAAVARAKLTLGADGGGSLSGVEVIWRQVPKVAGRGHYAHRLAFGPDGDLWISSGDRQKFDPAQDMESNLGKVLRLNPDGSAPDDNPFAGEGEVAGEVWSLGHRNPLGMAFDGQDRLWVIEMGPKGGDELNLVERGGNYGYPIVSDGDHYDGRPIPDHDTQPQFNAPAVTWTPVISPSSLVFYSGDEFPQWQGDAFTGALSGQALVRLEFEGESASEAERFDMDARIRAVEQGPEGDLWLLEDGDGGALLRLSAPPVASPPAAG